MEELEQTGPEIIIYYDKFYWPRHNNKLIHLDEDMSKLHTVKIGYRRQFVFRFKFFVNLFLSAVTALTLYVYHLGLW